MLTYSLAPLSVDAGLVSLLLLAETQGPEGGCVPCVCAPWRVGGHPGKCAQLRRGRWRGTGPGNAAALACWCLKSQTKYQFPGDRGILVI